MFFIFFLISLFVPSILYAAEGHSQTDVIDRTAMLTDPWAILALIIFVVAYVFVLMEEKTELKKSKPVILAAGLIWAVIAIMAPTYNIDHDMLHSAVMHGLEEYAALLLFLIGAMTYITVLEEREVFGALRGKLVTAGLDMRQLFWVTGIVTFFLSSIADNLTTSLVMGAVVLAVGGRNTKFIAIACLNIVNSANAGGAFSPFGDITTLMVWQAGHVEFFEFFKLFFPAMVSYLIPAIIMSFFVPLDKPEPLKEEVHMKRGAKTTIFLGFSTIVMAISFEQFLGLPAFLGMMLGMGFLMVMAYIIRKTSKCVDKEFYVLEQVGRAEWDTLLFFFGVIFCVGGLSFIGYLELLSHTMYEGYGDTVTNIGVGFASAIIDNIPVMFAILTMDPQMDHFQWLLVTLTAGIGGSMLSIGSAAGVALMGVAHGKYTFMGHLKWAPVILLGYAAAIATHFALNGDLMVTVSH